MPPLASGFRAKFDRPVFIISSPRSGSSLLFVTMAQAPGIFTIGGESHAIIESIDGLHPFARGWTSNRLVAADATPEIAEALSQRFHANLRDRDGHPADASVRLIEKTPKNSLRILFLDAIFPDALFVYLYRDPKETLSSMIEAWSSGRFVTYPRLPEWPAPAWSLLLVPEWRALRGRGLAEIVAYQWAATTRILLDDLAALPPDRVRAISYDRLTAAPQRTMEALCRSLGIGWDQELGSTLPLSPTVVSVPSPDKWRRHQAAIAELWPIIAPIDATARLALSRYPVVSRD